MLFGAIRPRAGATVLASVRLGESHVIGPPAALPGDSPIGGDAHLLPRAAFTPWRTRVAGAIIDVAPMLLLTALGVAFAVATKDRACVPSRTGYGVGMSCRTNWTVAGVIVFTLLDLAALAFVIWNYGYRQGTTGSSVGKSVLKFRVVDEKTWQPIGFSMSIVRQLAHVLDTLICYLGYLFPLWDAKRQTFADKLMSTVCVPLSDVAHRR